MPRSARTPRSTKSLRISSTELYTDDRLNAIEYPVPVTNLLNFKYNYAGDILMRTDELLIDFSDFA